MNAEYLEEGVYVRI